MPYRRRGSYRRRNSMRLRPVNSVKNVVEIAGSTGTTKLSTALIKSVQTVTLANKNEVEYGSHVYGINLSFDVCGLAASGVRQITNLFLIKNPGNNLVIPGAFTVGSSNEKKFVFKQWSFQTMRNQDGNPPYHFDDYIKIPKHYQRFGTDDFLYIVAETDSAAGHISGQCIYKFFK